MSDFEHYPGCAHVQNMARPRSQQLIGPKCDCVERQIAQKNWEDWLDSDEGKKAMSEIASKEVNMSKESGFEPLDGSLVEPNPCRDMSHAPPTHLHIPQGQQYRHVCPGCGREVVLRPPQVRF